MKRIIRFCLMAAAALAVVTASSPHVYATCPAGVSNPMTMAEGGFLTGCPDLNPVFAYAYDLSNPSASNTGGINFICRSDTDTTGQGQSCAFAPGSGAAGDGLITVLFDFGNPGPVVGCPNPAGDAGGHPLELIIVANNGAAFAETVHWSGAGPQYIVESPWAFDAASPFFADSPSCSTGTLQFVSKSSAGGTDSVCVKPALPALFSDCSPSSLGAQIGSCVLADGATPDVAPNLTTGNIYTLDGPCGQNPDVRLSAGWVLRSSTPGANGSVCFSAPTPASGACRNVGATFMVNGVETTAISGNISAAGPNAAVNKIDITSLSNGKGTIGVNFATKSESGLVGFNIYAGSSKLNTSLIAAKGTGDNAYSYEVGRGTLKGNKSITVEGVLSDGSVVKSNPASVK